MATQTFGVQRIFRKQLGHPSLGHHSRNPRRPLGIVPLSCDSYRTWVKEQQLIPEAIRPDGLNLGWSQ